MASGDKSHKIHAPKVLALLEKKTVRDLLEFVNAAGRTLKEVDDHLSVHDALNVRLLRRACLFTV